MNAWLFIVGFAMVCAVQAQTPASQRGADEIAYEKIKDEASEDELRAFFAAYPNSAHSATAIGRIGKFKVIQLKALQDLRDDPKATLTSDARAKLDIAIKHKNEELFEIGKLYADIVMHGYMGVPLAAQPLKTATIKPVVINLLTADQPVNYPLGQTWVFKKTDFLNSHAVSTYTRKITKRLPDGGYEVNDGQGLLHRDGTQTYNRNATETRTFGAGYVQYPAVFETGYSAPFKYKTTIKPKQGPLRTELSEGRLVVQHAYEEDTPLGKLPVLRIDKSMNWSIPNTHIRGTFTFVGAYSPKHRRYVVWEEMSQTHDGKILRNERHEMVSATP